MFRSDNWLATMSEELKSMQCNDVWNLLIFQIFSSHLVVKVCTTLKGILGVTLTLQVRLIAKGSIIMKELTLIRHFTSFK